MIAAEEARRVRRAVDVLSADQRVPVVLHDSPDPWPRSQSGATSLSAPDHMTADRTRRASFGAWLGALDDNVLVIFTETGFRDAVDERLFELAARNSLTLVISPMDEPDPPRAGAAPYLASIRFDRERAARDRWPAISAASWSTVAPCEIAELAARARGEMTDDWTSTCASRSTWRNTSLPEQARGSPSTNSLPGSPAVSPPESPGATDVGLA